MLGEQQRRQFLRFAIAEFRKFLSENALEVELLLEPDWHCRDKRTKSSGRITHVRLEQPLELDERFIVKDDSVELVQTQVF